MTYRNVLLFAVVRTWAVWRQNRVIGCGLLALLLGLTTAGFYADVKYQKSLTCKLSIQVVANSKGYSSKHLSLTPSVPPVSRVLYHNCVWDLGGGLYHVDSCGYW